jgi:hypothetical protein
MIPAWALVFFIPGAWHTFLAVMPWIIGLMALFAVVAVIMEIPNWCLALLTRAAKALPACWLFDGSHGPPIAPVVKQDDSSPLNTYYVSWDPKDGY